MAVSTPSLHFHIFMDSAVAVRHGPLEHGGLYTPKGHKNGARARDVKAQPFD